MKIYQIAYKNLLRKRVRSILTIVGIALSAWVLASLLGFNRGSESSLSSDLDKLGFQVILTAKGCPYEAATLMLKGGTGLRYMPERVAVDITGDGEVKNLSKMLMQAVFDPNKGESGGIMAYLGVDPVSFPKMKNCHRFRHGAWFTGPAAYDAVLGYEAAELEQREVGDKILIPGKNIELTVAGVLMRSGTQDDGTISLPIKTVQKIFGKEGKITGVGIQVKQGVDMVKFEEKLYKIPDVQVVSMAQVKQTIMSLVATAKVMVMSIAVIAIIISMVGVINTILMSVHERFREIGILKSMGAMPGDIFTMIWIETVILCTIGGLAGNALALVLAGVTGVIIRGVLPYAPTGNLVSIDAGLISVTTALIIVIGFLSWIYPALKAALIRPIESIRMED